MTAPHSDRDHSGDPSDMPFWPPAHRHAIETGQRPVNAESVARGQQQVIEAQRATLDAVRALAVDQWPTILGRDLLDILDAAPNETKAKP